jgi:hypothetical protein
MLALALAESPLLMDVATAVVKKINVLRIVLLVKVIHANSIGTTNAFQTFVASALELG